jgi:hypothetical protein
VALGTVYGPTVALVLPLGLVALWLLLRHDAGRARQARFAGALALGFALVFFGLNARTGWVFFGWYAYPLAAALIAALVFIGERWARLVRGPAGTALVAALVVACVPLPAARYYLRHGPGWSVDDNPLLAMSYQLADRMRGRSGRFAMGAIAGMATYALAKPVFQLEGLVADHALVHRIRRQDPLEEVLRAYEVDYLVVSLAGASLERHDGCYVLTQPHAEWAGPRTAKLRGVLCAEPIDHFATSRGPNPWSRFSALETFVWDVRGARWGRPQAAAAMRDP